MAIRRLPNNRSHVKPGAQRGVWDPGIAGPGSPRFRVRCSLTTVEAWLAWLARRPECVGCRKIPRSACRSCRCDPRPGASGLSRAWPMRTAPGPVCSEELRRQLDGRAALLLPHRSACPRRPYKAQRVGAIASAVWTPGTGLPPGDGGSRSGSESVTASSGSAAVHPGRELGGKRTCGARLSRNFAVGAARLARLILLTPGDNQTGAVRTEVHLGR